MHKSLLVALSVLAGSTPALSDQVIPTLENSAPSASSAATKKATLVLASVLSKGYKGGVSLVAIPVESMEKCEEQGAMLLSSERLKAPRLGFECIETR